jgi:glyoxylase-like metal-dependent hydrolase (beta-lactamase superfamily II)
LEKPWRAGSSSLLKIWGSCKREGDIIGSLRVIAAPGHTPGQIELFDSRNSALIDKDAFSSIVGLTVTGRPNALFPFPAWGTWDAKTALASAEKLTRVEPFYLAPRARGGAKGARNDDATCAPKSVQGGWLKEFGVLRRKWPAVRLAPADCYYRPRP